jgi:hypothetical protein
MKKIALLGAALYLPALSMALDFEFDNGINISLDSTITYSAQWRVEDRHGSQSADEFLVALQENPFLPLTDPEYSASQTLVINGDDGNNNFDTGLIANRLTYVLEMDANWKSYGLFLRGRAYYDSVYIDSGTDLDAAG